VKLKLAIDLKDGRGTREMTTTLFVIAEWERTENRKVTDGRGIGVTDMACWAYTLCKMAGDPVPATWQEWLQKYPDIEIDLVDQTNPNPTVGAPTDYN
jgi:hypothetical protein